MREKLEEGDQERDGKKITSDTSGRWEQKEGRIIRCASSCVHYNVCVCVCAPCAPCVCACECAFTVHLLTEYRILQTAQTIFPAFPSSTKDKTWSLSLPKMWCLNCMMVQHKQNSEQPFPYLVLHFVSFSTFSFKALSQTETVECFPLSHWSINIQQSPEVQTGEKPAPNTDP